MQHGHYQPSITYNNDSHVLNTTSAPFVVSPNLPLEEKKQRRRIHCLKEILSSERTYVANLTKLSQHFMEPMREMARSHNGLVTTEEVERIFSNLSLILNFNMLLLSDLENAFTAADLSEICIGHIFLRLVRTLIYTHLGQFVFLIPTFSLLFPRHHSSRYTLNTSTTIRVR